MKRVGYIDFIRIFEENLNTCIYGCASDSYLSGIYMLGILSDNAEEATEVGSPQSGEEIRSGRFFPMEEAIPEEVRMAPPPEARKKKKKHSVKQEKQPEKEQKQVPLQTEKPEEDRSEYAFRTPSDARRAFIYSEIFRRKYD